MRDDDDAPTAEAPAGRLSRNGAGAAEPAETPAADRGPDRSAPPPFDSDAT